MPSQLHRTNRRQIEVLDDVVVALDSLSASFPELMDCVAIARSSGDLRLARLAAEQAFDQLTAVERRAPSTVRQAAELVVRLYVAEAQAEQGLPRQLRRAKTWLDMHRPVLDQIVGPEYADDEMRLLSEVQARLATSDPDGRARLGARLDQLDPREVDSRIIRLARATSNTPVS